MLRWECIMPHATMQCAPRVAAPFIHPVAHVLLSLDGFVRIKLSKRYVTFTARADSNRAIYVQDHCMRRLGRLR